MDLWGRLSNPHQNLEQLPDQGWSTRERSRRGARSSANSPEVDNPRTSQEEKGRLSNPVLRRLSPTQIDRLVDLYAQGATIDALAAEHGVHRTTVMTHLATRGVARRRIVRKMTDETVAQAARCYTSGLSLDTVAAEAGVHQRTLARELRSAGVPIRTRNGWPGTGQRQGRRP